MADARFRDLCLDARDPHPLAAFWGAALHREVHVGSDDDPYLTGPGGRRDGGLTWVDPVPEPRTGKTRVHLDLRLAAADPAPLVQLGARVVRDPDGDVRWWVLADPEGNEFCAMPPAPPEWGLPPADRPTPFELVVDCADPAAIGGWWAERFGVTLGAREGGPWRWLEGVAGFPLPFWVFNPVPEPKTVKNRMHWDVDLTTPTPAALVGAGARVLREPDGEIRWWVLADPEGNEFCAFPPE
jgi:hypothetical protein